MQNLDLKKTQLDMIVKGEPVGRRRGKGEGEGGVNMMEVYYT
jgi:hypothetical protein